jgi:hypothetical protein
MFPRVIDMKVNATYLSDRPRGGRRSPRCARLAGEADGRPPPRNSIASAYH